MKEGRHILTGLLMAVLSCVIILGSISLSLMESGFAVAQAPEVTLAQDLAFNDLLATLVYTPPPGSNGPPAHTAAPTQAPTLEFTPNPTCVPPSGWLVVKVPAGETLGSMASRYGISIEALQSANCYQFNTLIAGSMIYVPNNPPATRPTRHVACSGRPNGWVYYIVRPGDTLYALSHQLGTTVNALMSANCLTSIYIISGQGLYVPYLPPAPTWFPSATPVPSRTPTRFPTQTSTSTPPIVITRTPTGTPTSTSVIPPTYTIEPTATPTWLQPTDTPWVPPYYTNTPEVPPEPTNTPWVPPPPTDTPWAPPPPTNTPWAPPPPPLPTDTPWVPPPQPSDTPWVSPPADQSPGAADLDGSFLARLFAFWVSWIPSP